VIAKLVPSMSSYVTRDLEVALKEYTRIDVYAVINMLYPSMKVTAWMSFKSEGNRILVINMMSARE